MSLNSEQQEYVEYLNTLPSEQKCGCGWFTREECITIHCNGGARPEDAEAAKWYKLGFKTARDRFKRKLNNVLDNLVKNFGSAHPNYEETKKTTSLFSYYIKNSMRS